MKKILSLLILPTFCYAAHVTHTDYVSGQTITAAGQNTNENNLINDYNGNIDATNVKSGSLTTTQLSATAGILGSQLSNSAGITGGQIANQTITGANLVNSTIGAAQIASTTITATQIANNTITATQLANSAFSGSTANSGGAAGNINQGTVSTPDFRANAVSVIASTLSATSSANSTIAQTTITSIGKPILLFGFATISVNGAGGTGQITFTVDITDNSGPITGCETIVSATLAAGNTYSFPATVICTETPGASTQTYTLSYHVTQGTFNTIQPQHTLLAIELRA